MLTTNFDPLVMRACALLGEFPAVYDFAASQFLNPADVPDKAIFHLHGQRTGFVLMNTRQECDEHSKRLGPLFQDAGRGRVWIAARHRGDYCFGVLFLTSAERKATKVGAEGISSWRQPMEKLSDSSFKHLVLPCMTAALVLLAAGIGQAGSIFIVTLAQVGPNVVATGSGTIDLTGLTSFGSAFASPELYPAHGIIGTGPAGTIDQYTGSSGPASFGPGFGGFPSSTSGDSVFLEDFGLGIDVPQGYVSGTGLSSSATYSGTLASLGTTPGTYTWTWDSGANSLVLEIPTTLAPEPGSFLLMGIGLLAGLGLARKQVSADSARP